MHSNAPPIPPWPASKRTGEAQYPTFYVEVPAALAAVQLPKNVSISYLSPTTSAFDEIKPNSDVVVMVNPDL